MIISQEAGSDPQPAAGTDSIIQEPMLDDLITDSITGDTGKSFSSAGVQVPISVPLGSDNEPEEPEESGATPDVSERLSAAFDETNYHNIILRNMQRPDLAADPDWSPSASYFEEDFKAREGTLSFEQYETALESAESEGQFKQNVQAFTEQNERLKTIYSGGVASGLGLSLFASIADPSNLLLSAATLGLATPLKVLSTGTRLARMGKHATAASAVPAGFAAYQLNQDVTYRPQDAMLDIVAAGVLGSLGGIRGVKSNPTTARLDQETNRLGKSLEENAEAIRNTTLLPSKTRPKEDVGLPDTLSTKQQQGDKSQKDAEFSDEALDEPTRIDKILEDAQDRKSAAGNIRFDLAASGGTSDNKVIRQVSAMIMPDSNVSKETLAAGKVQESAFEHMETYVKNADVEFVQSENNNYRNWLKAHGHSSIARNLQSDKLAEFRELVTFINRGETFPSDTKGLEFAQAHADIIAKGQKRAYRDAGNPDYAGEGLKRAVPVRGARTKAGEPVESYMTRIWNRTALREAASNPASRVQTVNTLSKALRGFDDEESAREFASNLIDILVSNKTQGGTSGGSKSQGQFFESVNSTFKNRVIDIDENAQGVKAFLENDSAALYRGYMRGMAGRISLARQGIDSEQTFRQLLNKAKEADGGVPPTGKRKVELKNLEDAFNATMGRSDPSSQTSWGQALRTARTINFNRLMGQVGFSQIAEFGVVLAETGFKSVLKAVPSAHKMLFRASKDGKYADEALEELTSIIGGFGNYRLLNNSVRSVSEDATEGQVHMARLDRNLQHISNVVSDISGMNGVTSALQNLSVKAHSDRFLQASKKFKNGQGEFTRPQKANRMLEYGLDDTDLKAIYKEINSHASGGKLNIDSWEPSVLAKFQLAFNRMNKRTVQENHLGDRLSYAGGHEVTKTVLQFRSFMQSAWAKNLLYNVKHADRQAVESFAYQTVFAGIGYMLWVHANKQFNEDPEGYYDTMTEPKRMWTSIFQRSGYASLIPALTGTIGDVTMDEDPFQFGRSSGQGSSLLFQNPTYGLIVNGIGGTAKEGLQALTGHDPWTSSDMTNALSIMPAYNALVIKDFVKRLASEFPEEEREEY